MLEAKDAITRTFKPPRSSSTKLYTHIGAHATKAALNKMTAK